MEKSKVILEPQKHGGALCRSGGKRENSGRSPDWLRQKCQSLIDKNKIVEFLADVAGGKNVATKCKTVFDIKTKKDKIVKEKVPADIHDRLHAADMLLDRGWGKPPLDMNVKQETKIDESQFQTMRNEVKKFLEGKNVCQ